MLHRPGSHPRLLTLLSLLAFVPPATGQESGLDGSPFPEDCEKGMFFALGAIHPWSGEMRAGTAACLTVDLEPGARARARVLVQSASPISGVTVGVWAPDSTGGQEQVALLRPTLGEGSPSVPLSWLASSEGPHTLVLRDYWSWQRPGDPAPARVWIERIEPPDVVRALRRALADDPRVAWLRDHAVPVRTVSPEDEDFRDLAPLREALDGVRVVLLGESTHGSGTDLLAKARLVKFLHRDLDYDVIAFESGLYEMSVAWDSLRAGRPGPASFDLGTWGMWTRSRQMEALIDYVAKHARGATPLEVAGFDNQFLRRRASTGFVDDLERIFSSRDIESPLVREGAPVRRALEAMTEMRFRRGETPLPPPGIREAVAPAMRDAAAALARHDDAESDFWREVLEGRACHVRRIWAEAGRGELPARCFRDRQMATHLVWLARHRYPDRKIIVWAATGHAMRTDHMSAAAGPGPSMGREVARVLGEQAYTLAMTSYRGTFALPNGVRPQQIVRDQDPLFEFEELMEAAGFEYAFMDLRGRQARESWLAGPFLARPDGHQVAERVWSDVLDGLFFVREQHRNSRAEAR